MMSMPARMPKLPVRSWRTLTGKDRKRFMVNCSLQKKKKKEQFRAVKLGARDLKQAGFPHTQGICRMRQQEVVREGRKDSLLNDPTGCLDGLFKPRREQK